ELTDHSTVTTDQLASSKVVSSLRSAGASWQQQIIALRRLPEQVTAALQQPPKTPPRGQPKQWTDRSWTRTSWQTAQQELITAYTDALAGILEELPAKLDTAADLATATTILTSALNKADAADPKASTIPDKHIHWLYHKNRTLLEYAAEDPTRSATTTAETLTP